MLNIPYDDGFLMDTKNNLNFVRDHSMVIHGQLASIKFLTSEFFFSLSNMVLIINFVL